MSLRSRRIARFTFGGTFTRNRCRYTLIILEYFTSRFGPNLKLIGTHCGRFTSSTYGSFPSFFKVTKQDSAFGIGIIPHAVWMTDPQFGKTSTVEPHLGVIFGFKVIFCLVPIGIYSNTVVQG